MKQDTMPEFVGTTVLDTIGLVIASVDPGGLRKKMKIKENYRSVGIISSRTGAAGQITAVDDAVKRDEHRSAFHYAAQRYQRLGRTWKLHCDRRRDRGRCQKSGWRLHWKRRSVMPGRSMSAMPDIWNLPIPHGGSGTWFCLRHSQRKSLWICLRISGSDRFCHGGSGGESSRCGHRKIYDAG